MPISPKSDSYFSKSVDKGMRLLSLFNEHRRSMSQKEIAAALGLNSTSTFRYVNTLIQLGFLERSAKSKRLRPALKAIMLGVNLLKSIDAHQIIKAAVDAVHDHHGITIDVALAVEDKIMTVYRREAQETLVYRLPVVAAAWHTTALGKAYLSQLPEAEMLSIIEQMELSPRTPKTIVAADALIEELQSTRRRGYSRADEEYMPGLIAIGAPIVNEGTGRVKGSVSFDFSTIQFGLSEVEAKYSEILTELAKTLSGAMASL